MSIIDPLTRPVRIPVRRASPGIQEPTFADAAGVAEASPNQRVAHSGLTRLGWILVASNEQSRVYRRRRSVTVAQSADELAA